MLLRAWEQCQSNAWICTAAPFGPIAAPVDRASCLLDCSGPDLQIRLFLDLHAATKE